MRLDFARKIVRFKNGQFGIRRWTLIGYQYLGLNLHTDDFWWSIPCYVAAYAAGTEEQARVRLAQYLKPSDKPLTPGYDKGRPA